MILMQTKIILICFCTLAVMSVLSAYYKYIILEDYVLIFEVPCNTEKLCFAGKCEGGNCEQDDVISNSYSIIEIQANVVSGCDATDYSCIENACLINTNSCNRVLCDASVAMNCIQN